MLNTNLNSFINIEAKPGGMTEEKDDDNGEEEGNHGGVSPVVVGDGVVQGGSSEMVKICESHVFKIFRLWYAFQFLLNKNERD